MTATLYDPSRPPKNISTDGLGVADFMNGYMKGIGLTAELLRSTPKQVDILASGPGYIIFSVFDHEGEVNLEAMQAINSLTGMSLDLTNEDEVLRGPILVIKR